MKGTWKFAGKNVLIYNGTANGCGGGGCGR